MKKILPWVALVVVVAALLDFGGGSSDPGPWDETNASGLQVIEMELPDIQVACTDPPRCSEDYIGFLGVAVEHARPRDEAAYDALFGPPAEQDDDDSAPAVDGVTLRDAVVEATGLAPLLEGLDERELLVAERSNTPGPTGHELRLIFEDPFVGVFEAMLLLPHGDGPHPVVVAHPGIGATLEDWRDRLGGPLSAGGVGVLVLQPRALDAGRIGGDANAQLLRAGFTLIGLRIYETLLMRKYLRWLPDADPDRVGLIGEGEGAAVGNLALRVEPGWAAYATDGATPFVPSRVGGLVWARSVPGLGPWQERIDDFASATVPVHVASPGYGDGPGGLTEFLTTTLRPGR